MYVYCQNWFFLKILGNGRFGALGKLSLRHQRQGGMREREREKEKERRRIKQGESSNSNSISNSD